MTKGFTLSIKATYIMNDLTLGDFVFSGFEIPEKLPLGGDQRLVTHKFPGGARVIEAMGADEAHIHWRGQFRGGDAMARAKYLDTLRINGPNLLLKFREFRRAVIISSFNYHLHVGGLEIPYEIKLSVVANDDNPVTVVAPSADELLAASFQAMDAQVTQLGSAAYAAALQVQMSAAQYQAFYAIINAITIAYLEAKAAYQNMRALTSGNLAALGSVAMGATGLALGAASSLGAQQSVQNSLLGTSLAVNQGIKAAWAACRPACKSVPPIMATPAAWKIVSASACPPRRRARKPRSIGP